MMEDARIALGGDATDEEIAKHIGMDIKKYRKLQRMSVIMNVLSLDMITDDEGGAPVPAAFQQRCGFPAGKAFLKGESRQVLAQAVESLKEKEKMVISLYYVEEFNMGQIAQVLGGKRTPYLPDTQFCYP